MRHDVGMANASSFGARLRALRKERHLSQHEVAAELGVARSTLASIEAGHDLPGRETMVAMSVFYGVPLDYLETGRHPAFPPNSGELVDDPDELALLGFWRGLDTDERDLMLKMLGRPGRRDAAA